MNKTKLRTLAFAFAASTALVTPISAVACPNPYAAYQAQKISEINEYMRQMKALRAAMNTSDDYDTVMILGHQIEIEVAYYTQARRDYDETLKFNCPP